MLLQFSSSVENLRESCNLRETVHVRRQSSQPDNYSTSDNTQPEPEFEWLPAISDFCGD